MEAWSGFAGAVVGGALTGAISILLQRGQHKHALEVQKREWENERDSRNEERETARQEEFNKEQRNIWRELRQITPRYVHVSQWIYQRKLEFRRESEKAGPDPTLEHASDREKENLAHYREL